MTAFDFEGNDWDEITEGEKRAIVDRLLRSRDALSEDYEALAAEHDKCPLSAAEWADQLSGEHAPHRGNHIDYACGFSGPHCWQCGEPWPCRSERRVTVGPRLASTAPPPAPPWLTAEGGPS